MNDTAKNCWTCNYQDTLGQDTLLGRCRYFVAQGRPVKDIPPEVVHKGCKFWKIGQTAMPNDNYETEERIALVADGCNLTQKEAEIAVRKMNA